ncbi:MAG: hypothetical protein GTO18_06330 [Anaerolineales bacterium]|nr:hypothetical protein [Anaerolineales bacterium]
MADEPQIPMDEQDDTLPKSERVFRIIVILGAAIIAIILITFGLYVAITVLGPQVDILETEILDLNATATAGCEVFLEEFPGTPCPEYDSIIISATATAACADYQEDFPGTPCP